jgi:CBS domain containing-hemolysin-like protein
MAASLMRRPRRLLQTLLLGNMLVNVAYEAVAAVMIIALGRRGLPAWAAVALAAVPVFVLILVGEVTPKMLAYRFAERWAVLAAVPLTLVCRAVRPVVWLLETSLVVPISRLIAPQRPADADITAGELSALLNLSAKRGIIGHDASALMQEIVHLTGIRVSDIMVPRVDVISYDVNDPAEGLIDLFAKTRLRKVPVYDGKIDNVLGVIHAKRLLLNPSRPLRELVSPVVFIPEAANIERALLQFRIRRAQTAIVVDEYGGVAGLITLEDVAERIVGDIEEAHEAARGDPVRQISRDVYMLDGDLAIHEWAQAFGIDLAERRVSTIGGFVTSLLGRIAAVGDEAAYRNLRFTVEQMRGRRISKVRLALEEEAS